MPIYFAVTMVIIFDSMVMFNKYIKKTDMS